jgi:hypothetical protein
MATIDYLEELPVSILNQDPTSNVGKLWTLFSEQMDLLNLEITAAYNLYIINSQSGVNLDQIGKLVRQSRDPGESDADYRISLFAAISSNISSGSIPDLLSVVELTKEQDEDIALLLEIFPANIQIFTNIASLIDDNLGILNSTRAAGIGLFVNYATGVVASGVVTGVNQPFVFSGDDTGLGFSDIGATGVTASGAGVLVEIIT